jgi:hypothetical protein
MALIHCIRAHPQPTESVQSIASWPWTIASTICIICALHCIMALNHCIHNLQSLCSPLHQGPDPHWFHPSFCGEEVLQDLVPKRLFSLDKWGAVFLPNASFSISSRAWFIQSAAGHGFFS